MALIPETLFYNSVAVDTPDAGIVVGGNNWYEEYTYSQPGYNDNLFSIKNLFVIEPSELSALDDTIHTSRESGIKKKIFSFGSGVDFYVSIYARTEFELAVFVHGCIKYGNTYYYDIAGLSETQSSWSSGDTNPLAYTKNYGIKIACSTNYTWGQTKAVLGVTPATYFDILAFVPCYNKNYASGFQSWQHIDEKRLYFISHVEEDIHDVDDWVYNPQYLYYGYDINKLSGCTPVARINNLTNFYNALKAINPYLENPFIKVDPENPSQEDEPSTPGGGGGNMDKGSDPIDFPSLPVGGPLASGAIKAFEVDVNAITGMFIKLWDMSIFDISTFQKLVQEPLDALISLQCIPIDPHNGGTTPFIHLGNFDTEVAAPVIDQQYYTINCGSLKVEEYWGSALDYSPYTKVQIFLPFIGIRDLDVDDVMGKTIQVKYNYDILTGNLTAQIKCGQSVLYKFPGNVKQDVPVTSQVNTALEAFAHGLTNMAGAAIMGSTGALAAATISAAVNVTLAKHRISRSGDMEGSTGLLDDFNCYLIITRPIQSLAKNFNVQKGYPSNITAVLNTLSGYTEVEYIHLSGITGATDTELEEIENLLKSGVII